jgi:prepilin peptidase CpaA
MNPYHFLQLVPLLAMLVWAAIEDARTRRIRNWLTLSMVVTGFLQSIVCGTPVGPLDSLAGFLLGFFLLFVLFAIGAVGGGDVKIVAGVGAWVGAVAVFKVFCAEAVIGMLIVLGQAVVQGQLRVLTRNTASVAISLVHIRSVGLKHTTETGKSCQSVNGRLPYAVPVLLAVLFLVISNSL